MDDGSLALALVLWCAAVGLIALAVSSVPASVLAGALLVGCVATLLVNVALAARKRWTSRLGA